MAGQTSSHSDPRPRGLLAIFAHPDDESYGAGGVMALAATAGNPVWVLCATNGDQGGRPGEIGVDHSMDPETRREELRCACEAIGAAEPVFLGYRDSGMEGWGAPEGSLSLCAGTLATRARYRVTGPEQVRRFLRTFAEARNCDARTRGEGTADPGNR